MNFIKRFKGVLIAIGVCAVFMAISFYYPEQKETNSGVNETVTEDVLTVVEISEDVETIDPVKVETTEVMESVQTPVVVEEKNTFSCRLTVRCDTILKNLEKVAPEKLELIPESGIILPEREIEFLDGETVFDILQRELKKHKIHFEFSNVSMYDSVYIEGIGNLYEFDAGNLSGWLYRVNGNTPSVGCSQYKLTDNDKVEFLYTCNMGRDL